MQYVVLLAMAIFFGFAFEQFYGPELEQRPGGVRAFPLLSFAGAGLYLIEPAHATAFTAGLLVLGAWLFPWVRNALSGADGNHGYLMVPVCAVLAYALGPIALTQPMWFTVGLTVVAVLLIGSRARLHSIASRVPFAEILTLGQFLLLVGVVLPLLEYLPPIPFTTITPLKVWLAVVAVSTLSYVTYLLQRYVLAGRGVFVTAVLGGLYSSTATTIVLARAACEGGYTREVSAATIAATAMMYLRLLVVTMIFNLALGRMLAPWLIGLAILSMIAAFAFSRGGVTGKTLVETPENPLQLGTALVFAVLLIVFSQLSAWVTAHVGMKGLFELAAVVGFTDIDPFVLGVAQAQTVALPLASAAILVAASSNNVLKGIYAAMFSRQRTSLAPVCALLVLALAGTVAAWTIAR